MLKSTTPAASTSTLIAWTDLTANFWMGCVKVSAGCANCYAETLTKNRMGLDLWGKSANRQPVKNVFAKLRGLARNQSPGVLGGGAPKLVFVGSLMDWAEGRDDLDDLRRTIWATIREYPQLHFQLLTKRPENIHRYLPDDWGTGYDNVWLGTSVEDMRVASRVDELRKIPALVRFVSYEPALGPLDDLDLTGISWVIYGGESGPGHRPEGEVDDPKCWARSMRDKCEESGVAYFHKQSAAYKTEIGIELDGIIVRKFPEWRRPRSSSGKN